MTTIYRGVRARKHVSENIDKRPTRGVYRGVKWHSEDAQPAQKMTRGIYRGVKWGSEAYSPDRRGAQASLHPSSKIFLDKLCQTLYNICSLFGEIYDYTR